MSNMTFAEYEEVAKKTKNYKYSIVYPALGLNGEAGEVAEKIKKVLRDEDGQFNDGIRKEIAKELGDVLWYCFALADDIGFTLEEIADMNNKKLLSRLERNIISGSGDNR